MRALQADHPQDDWPLAQFSHLIKCRGLRWHVQMLGQGPTVVLLHGTGASTHSWRDVATQLSSDFHVVMCDLPGHGFTSGATTAQMSLGGMSQAIIALLDKLSVSPQYLVGHSAGAALSCQMALGNAVSVDQIVSINGALKPFDGMPGQLFGPLARALSANPLIPQLVSWRAGRSDRFATRLIDDTGSDLDPRSVRYYRQLLQSKGHVAGALNMMAHWDLKPLWQQLPQLTTPLHLWVATQDRTVLPRQGREASVRVANATLQLLPGLGHLAHEENPSLICHELRKVFTDDSTSKAPVTHSADDSKGATK